MTESGDRPDFMSAMIAIFSAVVCVMVLFALASSASILGQIVAFILAMVAFLFLIGFAVYRLQEDSEYAQDTF